MKRISYIILFSICFCSCVKKINIPDNFNYSEIPACSYTLASWQKISDTTSPIHIYIEGDGHSFNRYGYPTNDPTPHDIFLRQIAFNDPNNNVAYIARPGQFIKDKNKNQTDWTSGRFSKEIVESVSRAIKEISNNRKIILIGYSGGALLSGLVINQNPDLQIEKWITVAGVLNHTKWTQKLNLLPLKDSLDLDVLPNVNQVHLAGEKDTVVPIELIKSAVAKETLIIVPDATHNSGFESIYDIIYCTRDTNTVSENK